MLRTGRRSRPLRADVAQLVAHHLAKVRVAGSNPVIRSKVQVASIPAVEWPSGEATACKAVHTGSIPVSTSSFVSPARLAQRESASLTRKRSLVQSQYRAPQFEQLKACFRLRAGEPHRRDIGPHLTLLGAGRLPSLFERKQRGVARHRIGAHSNLMGLLGYLLPPAPLSVPPVTTRSENVVE